MRLEEARIFILDKLEQELPPQLFYHNVRHTEDVLLRTAELAAGENITGHELVILKTAALFHDTGFLETYSGHEAASCKLAASLLPDFGYPPENVQEVCQLIMATQLPQQPKNKLEKILCDADLFYLGTSAYKETAETLYRELRNRELIKTRAEWREKQIKFLQNHYYFTEYARELLSAGQDRTLSSLIEN